MTDGRWIAHLDMDAFYASVELLRAPDLRGHPVVIGGRRRGANPSRPGEPYPVLQDYVGRGVITTATYEARRMGVHSGMGLMKAAKLAPNAVLLPADFDEYRRLSRAFKAAVRAIAPEVEDRGIDEIYIDLTALVAGDWADPLARDRARALGAKLRAAVDDGTGLSCSIGITPNKLLSKVASDLEKPGGLVVLARDEIPARIWPLPARRINGIGPKANARLEALDIHTIGDLAAADPAMLVERFGVATGAWLHAAAHGRDDRPIVIHSEPKSVSRESTFEHDLHAVRDRERLSQIFTDLCTRVSEDLRRKGYLGRTIGIKLRYDNFRTVTRDNTVDVPTDDAQAIRRAAGACLKRVALDRKIRLLGVRVGALVTPAELQAAAATAGAAKAVAEPVLPSLFDD